MEPVYKKVGIGNPESMTQLEFKLLSVRSGETHTVRQPTQEAVVVILSGACSVKVDRQAFMLKRKNVIDELASAVYIPLGTSYVISGDQDAELAICLCSATAKKSAVFISSVQVKKKRVGRENFERYVYDIVDSSIDTQHLIVGETLNPPGNWSSFPPHKHDTEIPDREVKMEEIYYFKVSPPEGFGFQRLYTSNGDLDKAIVIKDDMVVNIPYGYHPVCSMPGYWIYYLWFLAGQNRILRPNTDPTFKWLETS